MDEKKVRKNIEAFNEKNNKMQNEKVIIKILTNKFYLSFSSLKEVLGILWELEIFKKENVIAFLEGINYSNNFSKKQKGNMLLKELRKKRYPQMTKSLSEIKKSIKEIEKNGKIIKMSIPENLEGDFLKLEIIVKKDEDIDEVINRIIDNKQQLKLILKKIQLGG